MKSSLRASTLRSSAPLTSCWLRTILLPLAKTVSRELCIRGVGWHWPHRGLQGLFSVELPFEVIQWFLFFFLNACEKNSATSAVKGLLRLDFLGNVIDASNNINLILFLSNSIKQSLDTGVVTSTCWERYSH